MWSVVTESPKIASTLAPRIAPTPAGVMEKPLKKGGSAM